MTDVIQSLQVRRQALLLKIAELDNAKQLANLQSKQGDFSTKIAKIAAERTVVDAVLANTRVGARSGTSP
jgi:hypothetical protein